MASGSTGVVLAAMFANAGIAVLKFIGFLLTGSPSMLAETYHSISDTGNQILLLIGIKYSQREVNRSHPFGFGKAQFFYAFLVSVLLFGIAGWESLTHGIAEIRTGGHPSGSGPATILGIPIVIPIDFDPFWVNIGALSGGILFETYAFVKARAELLDQMETFGWSGYRETFTHTSDVTTLTAFTEDVIALIGLVVALVGIVLARATGNHLFDAIGAAIIGVLLMGFALLLAIENKRLIVGESLPPKSVEAFREAIEGHEDVDYVDGDVRTMFIGTGEALVTADVYFDPTLTVEETDEAIERLEATLRSIDERVSLVYIEPKSHGN